MICFHTIAFQMNRLNYSALFVELYVSHWYECFESNAISIGTVRQIYVISILHTFSQSHEFATPSHCICNIIYGNGMWFFLFFQRSINLELNVNEEWKWLKAWRVSQATLFTYLFVECDFQPLFGIWQFNRDYFVILPSWIANCCTFIWYIRWVKI